jgi:hypothetical protein
MSLLTDALSGAAAIYGFDKGIRDVRDVGTAALERAKTEGTALTPVTEFRPFAVTSALGGAQATPTGGMGFTLTPEQEAIRQQLTQTGTGLIGGRQALADVYRQAAGEFGVSGAPAMGRDVLLGLEAELGGLGLGSSRQREQDLISMLASQPDMARQQQIYQELEAMQAPAREREQLALEQRLFGQGRGGVRTAMFGGTPEEFARAKAVEEARLGSAVQARQIASDEAARRSAQTLEAIRQGTAETGLFGELGLTQADLESRARQEASRQALAYQAQQLGLGTSLLGEAYRPQQELLATVQPSLDLANIGAAGQRQLAQLQAALIEAGLQSKLAGEVAASNLRQQQIQAISNIITGNRAAEAQERAAGATAAGSSGGGFFQELFNLGAFDKFGSAG